MGPTLGVASVGARGRLAVARESFNSVESIRAQHPHLCEWLVHHTCEHFSVVSDSALANFLGISNVQSCCLAELVMRMTSFLFDNLHDFFTTDWDLTAHGVLSRDDVLAETVEDGLVCPDRQRFAEKCLRAALEKLTMHLKCKRFFYLSFCINVFLTFRYVPKLF